MILEQGNSVQVSYVNVLLFFSILFFILDCDLYENVLHHFLLPVPSIKAIKEAFELKSKYPSMLQIHFKNTMDGSITLMDWIDTSYTNRKAFGLAHSFEELRDALSHSVNPNYTGVIKTDRTPFTFILEDFIAGRTQSLAILLLNISCIFWVYIAKLCLTMRLF
jgi:hypothetical protein